MRCKQIKDGIKGWLVVRVEISDYLKKSKKEEFLYSLLRHDLNNKLQINEGYLELMKDEGKLTKEQKKYWQRALKSAKDGIDLINKVKTALKVKDARTKKINISPILSKTLSQLDYDLKKQDIDTEFDLNSCFIKGGELLEEVFYNLINNSIKHSSCNKIRIYIEHENEECILVYEDDGCGVDKKHMNRLFEEGFTTGNGSGLGLYLVKEIINTYGGSIKPTTSESGGLRFNIKLKKVD
ncbi:MAG: sensor histidine kinase [Candidatus Saliniplasma sp.]